MANSLGTINGKIIFQRALEMCFTEFPNLSLFALGFRSVDGRADAMRLGQSASTRLLSPSAITNFGESASSFAMTDVNVKMRNMRQIKHSFTMAELQSSEINLVDQLARPMAVGLQRGITRYMWSAVCRANFGLTVNSQASYLAVASGWTRANTVLALDKLLAERGVPDHDRALIVNSDVYSALAQDTVIVANLNNPSNQDAIRTGKLPDVQGFKLARFPSMPNTDGNLLGAAMIPGALGYVARAPIDELPTPFPGLSGYVTDPSTGFTVLVDQWTDPATRKFTCRMSWLDGIELMDATKLVRLVSGVVAGSANTIVGATVINPGYGYVDSSGAIGSPTITVGGDGSSGAITVTANSESGAVGSPVVGTAGTGYTTAPLTVVPQSGGRSDGEATVVATIAGLG